MNINILYIMYIYKYKYSHITCTLRPHTLRESMLNDFESGSASTCKSIRVRVIGLGLGLELIRLTGRKQDTACLRDSVRVRVTVASRGTLPLLIRQCESSDSERAQTGTERGDLCGTERGDLCGSEMVDFGDSADQYSITSFCWVICGPVNLESFEFILN